MGEAAEERALAAQMKQPLDVAICGGELSITIGLETLGYAVTDGNPSLNNPLNNFKVTDAEEFAKAVLRELTREDEQGTTCVHKMLDAAAERAVDQGAEGIEEVSATIDSTAKTQKEK